MQILNFVRLYRFPQFFERRPLAVHQYARAVNFGLQPAEDVDGYGGNGDRQPNFPYGDMADADTQNHARRREERNKRRNFDQDRVRRRYAERANIGLAVGPLG